MIVLEPCLHGLRFIIFPLDQPAAALVADAGLLGYPDAEGELYICLQAHTSQEGWEPPAISALWAPASEGGQEDPPVTEAET